MVTAFLDANVLYPAPLRDFLVSLAEDDLFKPLWSDKINHEWRRNLVKNRPELDPSRIDRTIELMNAQQENLYRFLSKPRHGSMSQTGTLLYTVEFN